MTDAGERTAGRRQLRQQLRDRRRAILPSQRIAAADALARALLSLPFAPSTGYVGGYWAMDGEMPLHAWQLRLPGNCIYCLPVLGEDQRLRFAPWRPGDALVTNRFGIPEPDVATAALLGAEALSMAIVPLVGFDACGHRLGMGGGWYDRTFAFRHSRPAPPWLVGAAFALQQVASLDAEHWDVRLDAVCTESGAMVTSNLPA